MEHKLRLIYLQTFTKGRMSNYNYEGSGQDGDWDSGGELAWNEFDWQQYLKRNDAEQDRFLQFYLQLKHMPEHLDYVAQRMGWEVGEWNPAEQAEGPSIHEERSDPDELEPYTVHRHPVYVVTRALYLHLNNLCHAALEKPLHPLPTMQVLALTGSLHAGEMNAVMALNALDMGDYNLAVCHLKNALAALNHTMGVIQRMEARTSHKFANDGLSVCFDLREVWLRVMRECREEARFERDNSPDDED